MQEHCKTKICRWDLFRKKEKIKRNEEKNQNFLSFFKNDKVKKINDNAEKNAAWWSINGVPVVGYARIAMLKV